MAYEPSAPLTDGDYVGEIRNGYRWTGKEWVRDTGYYDAERNRKEEEKKKWAIGGGLLILLILLGLILWWVIAANNDDEEANPTQTPTQTVTATPLPGLGAPVQEGDIRFVVTSVTPGGKTLGTVTADGSFVLVAVTVTNTSGAPVAFSEANIEAVDTKGNSLDADSAAYAYTVNGGPGFEGEIAPGQTVNTFVAFDVTEGAALKTVVVRQPPTSDGEQINVS